MNSRNKKLIKNIFLMFLVYFLPKTLSFFMVPIYTSYLSTDEYGISDLIISSASLIAPFVSLATPSALLRYTIENKNDLGPYQISVRIFFLGMIILLFFLLGLFLFSSINIVYLLFVFLIVGSSLLSDIYISYVRGLEQMTIITICGVGSSFVSILSNVLFIVVFGWGLYGFLIATILGYIFSILVVFFSNNDNHLFKQLFSRVDVNLQREMLKFSIPLIFSGLSWWVVTLSDRFFISILCGPSENGLYSVANKIPVILQAVDNVFGQAWLFTLYDSYKTAEGKEYISKVFDVYIFFISFGAGVLIAFNAYLSSILFSKDFFLAWKYVPPLLLSIVFSSASGLIGGFLSVYKKTNISMWISVSSAFFNIILNWILISFFSNAMGAAIATAITFYFSYILTLYVGIKISGVRINWIKHNVVYAILMIQSVVMIFTQDIFKTSICLFMILIINWQTILWGKEKWRSLLRKKG